MDACLYYYSPFGRMCLTESEDALIGLDFDIQAEYALRETPLLKESIRQLDQYFQRKRQNFSLPLAPRGTAFQQKVWACLLDVHYGETSTYGEIAAKLGLNRGARAVGQANHRNPIAIIIPCHRIIGKNGTLTGYGGGLERKNFLLELEKQL